MKLSEQYKLKILTFYGVSVFYQFFTYGTAQQ